MNIIEKMKKEPRMLLAIVNFISFFLPWVSVSASGSTQIFGEVFSTGEIGTSITGFGTLEYSSIGIICYLIPIIIFVLPFIKSTKKITHYLYVLLPIIAIVMMFLVSILVASAGGEYGNDYFSISTNVHRLIGFWIAGACNIAIVVITAVKDFHIKSTNDLKSSLKNADVDNIKSQFSEAAKDLGSNIQKSTLVKCPKCGNKIPKGKKKCPKCGKNI